MEEFLTYQKMAIEVAQQLAQLGLGYFKSNLKGLHQKIAVETKTDQSLVSMADRAIEKLARELFAQHTPKFGFVGEEFGATACLSHNTSHRQSLYPKDFEATQNLAHFEEDLNNKVPRLLRLDEDTYWIVDPIDGTTNFLNGIPLWSILIALIHQGEPVVGVVALPGINELFYASKGNGAFYRALVNNREQSQACFVRPHRSLKDAHISCSSPKVFAHRGVSAFFPHLLNNCCDARTHSDAFGYTRVLCGGIDLMIDPMAAHYDLAAIQILFKETENAHFTTLHGHTHATAFRMGSAIGASSKALAEEVTALYRRWLLEQQEDPYQALTKDHQSWALAIEKGIAAFYLGNPKPSDEQLPLVEDIAILRGCEESRAISLKNGAESSPPSLSSLYAVSIRCVVSGGTALVAADLPVQQPSSLVLTALKAAHKQAEEFNHDPQRCILASREQILGDLSADVAQENWHSSNENFAEIADFLRDNGKAFAQNPASPIQVVAAHATLVKEQREQTFLDGSQHHYKKIDFKLGVSYTAKRGEDKRKTSFRIYQNHVPSLHNFKLAYFSEDLTTQKRATDLLNAPLVPEDISYDYLAIDADLLGLILHEAVGHAAEGDLVFLGQSGFAKPNTEDKLIHTPVAPDWINIAIDGSLSNCGFVPIDCEGVIPKRKLLVENGKLVDCIHTRQTARVAKKAPDGCSRQESLFHPSLNRMTSIWLQSKVTHNLPLISSAEERIDRPSPLSVKNALQKDGYLDDEKKVLFLSGWKGGTASCTNLEFRADVAFIYLISKSQDPILLREANFTGIATKCFLSAINAYGPILCRTIGTCGKDGQGVPTSDGGPAIMLLKKTEGVMVIGMGESEN